MNKLKTTIWIGVLANTFIAFAGLYLGIVFKFIFRSTTEAGSMPWGRFPNFISGTNNGV